MPWNTPTLKDTRRLTRDYVLSQLGAKAMIPNSVLRIMSDAMSGLTHLTLLYLDWLAKQLLPDTAEREWLDRHGHIWLKNADGSTGRKSATFARGMLQFAGNPGAIIPVGSLLMGASLVQYQTIEEGDIGSGGLGNAPAVALTPGIIGNLPDGTAVGFPNPPIGVSGTTTCYGDMTGGVDEETDEQLRERILFRIQKPPMGGDLDDYVAWTMAVPGVTRAWASSEMGIGTVTVRFMMDVLRADNYGLPNFNDVAVVEAYLDTVRPVAVKDFFVAAPILYFYDIAIQGLSKDDSSTRARIETGIRDMELKRSKPGQTWYRSWVDEAISSAIGEEHHELIYETQVMPDLGSMPTLQTVLYG
jgi:uncharacterized phage protein gp47/JayE